ncbi:MAG: hypothetical protein ACI9MC_001699 [Kiritimatiellia bacterium]|jgi:hypothetical protein
MTQGFYEQLGLERSAEGQGVHDAYTRVIAQLVRRRKALVDQGGDTARIDLARAQVDEAWAVLSDPSRRRRYDALVGLGERGLPSDPDALWEQVQGALVSPAAAAAVDVVRAMTHIQIGAVPAAFDVAPPGWRSDPDAPTQARDTQADVATEAFAAIPSHITAMPSQVGAIPPLVAARSTSAGLRMPVPSRPAQATPVSAAPTLAPPSISMPAPSTQAPHRPVGVDVTALVEQHGYGGKLIEAVRSAKGLSVHDVGESTRISVRYLSAIEADDHEHLPSTTFVRGYLKEVARTLGLDSNALVSGYLRRMGR